MPSQSVNFSNARRQEMKAKSLLIHFYTYIYYCFFRFQRLGQSASFGWTEKSLYMRASWLLIMFEVGVVASVCLGVIHHLEWEIKYPLVCIAVIVAPLVYIHSALFGTSSKANKIIDKYDALPKATNRILSLFIFILVILSCYFVYSFFHNLALSQ